MASPNFYDSNYGNTAMPTGNRPWMGSTQSAGGGGHWYDFLSKLQLPEILKILGSIGKGAGQTATMVGRQLPYAGPLVQAGEYGILNAVGKEDSPWAQGNAFIQRDKANKEQELMAQLMRSAQGLRNTGLGQENTQRDWELTQNPLKEKDTLLGIQNKEQEFQKGEIDIEKSRTDLDVAKENLARLLAIAKDYPYNQQVQDMIKEAKAKIASEEALATQRLSYAGKNQRWEPSGGSHTIPSWIETSAKEYAKTHTAGVNPLTYGISSMSPQTQAAFDASYQKKFNELLDTYNKQRGMSGGWSIIPSAGASTSMPGNADVQAGGTAGAPSVDEHIQNFWEYVKVQGVDPQEALFQLIQSGSAGGDGLDPAKPDEAEAIRQLKEQIGAMAQ